jgi:signal transduction histidine kinase
LQQCDVKSSWWRSLSKPHPFGFFLLLLTGLVLEFVVHYYLGITIVYTQFFYLIIVITGLWYGRKAIWIALLFGSLHVLVTYMLTGALSPDALIRGIMMLVVAFVIGTIMEQMQCYYDLIAEQNRELYGANVRMKSLNVQLEETQDAFRIANKKLNTLSSITRHDILNQLMALRTYLSLAREDVKDPVSLSYIDKEDEIAGAIQRQIDFTRFYQDIGVQAPVWHNLKNTITSALAQLNPPGVEVTITLPDLEIFADSLIEKVFYNLIENSLRHGLQVTKIDFSAQESKEGLVLIYRDNGTGISAEDKKKLFSRGFGKHTGLGLFLSREILAITGILISENGEQGKGVRFEILVPEGKYRPAGPGTS